MCYFRLAGCGWTLERSFDETIRSAIFVMDSDKFPGCGASKVMFLQSFL